MWSRASSKREIPRLHVLICFNANTNGGGGGGGNGVIGAVRGGGGVVGGGAAAAVAGPVGGGDGRGDDASTCWRKVLYVAAGFLCFAVSRALLSYLDKALPGVSLSSSEVLLLSSVITSTVLIIGRECLVHHNGINRQTADALAAVHGNVVGAIAAPSTDVFGVPVDDGDGGGDQADNA